MNKDCPEERPDRAWAQNKKPIASSRASQPARERKDPDRTPCLMGARGPQISGTKARPSILEFTQERG